MRNYRFHKKFFARLNFAFDYWEPAIEHNVFGATPESNFDTFRKNVKIMGGFYDAHYLLYGAKTFDSKSISFGSMSEDEFEKLYSACVDVILKHVCTQFDGDMLDSVIDQTMAFA